MLAKERGFKQGIPHRYQNLYAIYTNFDPEKRQDFSLHLYL